MRRSLSLRTVLVRAATASVAAVGLLFVETSVAAGSVSATGAGVSVELGGGPDDDPRDPDDTDDQEGGGPLLDPIIEPLPLGDMWD
ncbi:hypothetical protein FDO65_20610 [Nakamurella flava]|uniref:Uncharacterized protein n=1 Tax=Nakamurella flava TaxID=2576308 RepID=A0A4V6CSU5_9ACTN|nr:hypothetical protein [Nakamurella flava]TKV56365.1 hypothetical protein FDO65_20610 [Nakamurella flava]